MGTLAVGRVRVAELDAVTLDAYGTLVTLIDPVPALAAALATRGVEREVELVRHGFRTEAAYYREHASAGYDENTLTQLRANCAGVFLGAVEADLDAQEFGPVYADAMHFELLPGIVESLERLRALGLELAIVGNWDVSLRDRLDEVGLTRYFTTLVHAAGKPAPDGLLQALERLHVPPQRALHIGDDDVDEEAARAAGMRFARAPVADAVAALT